MRGSVWYLVSVIANVLILALVIVLAILGIID